MELLDFSALSNGASVQPGQMERLRAETINKTPGNLDEEDGYKCPLCLNRGYTMAVKEEDGMFYMISERCKCDSVRKNIRRMKRSGLEKLIQKCKFENFEETDGWQSKLKQEAISYTGNPEGIFFIGGSSGVGKTHLCTAICRKLLLCGRDVLYMLWRDESNRLKGLLNTEQYNVEVNKYKTVDALYIDDLFKTGRIQTEESQKPTQGDINLAFEIINYRSNADLTTIISSECTLKDLFEIDEAIAGRIADGAHTFSIAHDPKKNYRMRNMVEL